MRMKAINHVTITAEAAFDYEQCLFENKYPSWAECLAAAEYDPKKAFEYAGRFDYPIVRLNSREIRAELEEGLDNLCRFGRLTHGSSFCYKYLDEKSRQMLMLFLSLESKFNMVQNWLLVGICFTKDWNELAECGKKTDIWLERKITELDYDNDWVINLRIRQGKPGYGRKPAEKECERNDKF